MSKVNPNGGAIAIAPPGERCEGACERSYGVGETVTLTALPDADRRLAAWTGACADATGTECTLTLTEDAAAGAAFGPAAHAVEVTTSGAGTGVVVSSPPGIDCGRTCAASFPYGETVTLNATPDLDSRFAGWTNTCSGTAPTCVLDITEARAVQIKEQLVAKRAKLAKEA